MRLARLMSAALVAVLVLGSVVPVAAIPQMGGGDLSASVQAPSPDYTLDDASQLVYRNQKGFSDKNGDGKITVKLVGTINFSKADRDGVTYSGDKPFVVFGRQNAVVTHSSSNGIATEAAALTVSQVTFRRIGGVPVSSGGALVAEDVVIRRSAGGFRAGTADNTAGNAQLRNVTVTRSKWGFNVNGPVSVRASSFTRLGKYGGVVRGKATVSDTIFSQIRAPNHRGGALLVKGDTIVKGSEFAHLRATVAGAIKSTGSTTIRGTTFNQVESANNAGAILSGGELTVVNSRFNRTNAVRTGGVALFGKSNITIRKSTFTNIKHPGDDGVVVIAKHGFITVTDSTFRDVQSGPLFEAGFIMVQTGPTSEAPVFLPLTISGSTFVNTRGLARSFGNTSVTDSVFYRTGGFDMIVSDRYNKIPYSSFTRTTFYAPASEIIPKHYTTLSKVNVLEAPTPVFAGELPAKSAAVFLDTNEDDEEWGSWTSDAVYSVDKPYPSYERLDGRVPESITTPTPTASPIPETVSSDTATVPPADTPSPTPTETNPEQTMQQPGDTSTSDEDSSPGAVPVSVQDTRQEQLIRIGLGIAALLVILFIVKRLIF